MPYQLTRSALPSRMTTLHGAARSLKVRRVARVEPGGALGTRSARA